MKTAVLKMAGLACLSFALRPARQGDRRRRSVRDTKEAQFIDVMSMKEPRDTGRDSRDAWGMEPLFLAEMRHAEACSPSSSGEFVPSAGYVEVPKSDIAARSWRSR